MYEDEFDWNDHEKNIKIEIPSKYKIRVIDDLELRIELEKIINELPQKYLAIWAIENAQRFKEYFDDNLKDDTRISQGEIALNNRIKGKINAFELRKVGFVINGLAKESKTHIGKYAARVFVQAVSVGHMRGHAIVSSDYGVKVINILYPDNNEKIIEERNAQINLAREVSRIYENKKD